MICEVVLPLDKRVKEGKEFDEFVVKKQFAKIDHRLDRLAEKLQGENIKIWAPYLETLIDKRWELVDVSHRRDLQEIQSRIAQFEHRQYQDSEQVAALLQLCESLDKTHVDIKEVISKEKGEVQEQIESLAKEVGLHKEEQASSITQISASISQLTEALKESLPAFQESCTIRFTSQSNKSDSIQVALSDLKSHVDKIQNQLQTLQERNPDKVMEGVKRYQEMLDQKLEEAMINVGLSYRKILACVQKKDFDIELAKVNDKYDKEIQVLKENIEALMMSNRRERTQSRQLNNSVTKKPSEISPQRTRKQSYNIEMQQPDNTAPHKQHTEFAIVPQNFHIKTGESVEQSIGFQSNDLSASNSEPSINHRLSQIKEEEQLNPSIIASQNERVHSPMQNEALSIMRQSTQPLVNEEPQICSSNQFTSHQYSKSKLHSLLSQDQQDPSQDSEHMDFVTKLEFERLLDEKRIYQRGYHNCSKSFHSASKVQSRK
ncbi:hypothetical protein FGO68_gene15589 [Halteria grandinella]|uniref:Uncharacterized protein n=1 Tax=Halteria grandinella TaxID=5974 RepID=A0A8J8N9S6_HALGN|nr:hypothetical protein FGO68_gene15589 [Halteria grandinella]